MKALRLGMVFMYYVDEKGAMMMKLDRLSD